jgi:hypothetical protein
MGTAAPNVARAANRRHHRISRTEIVVRIVPLKSGRVEDLVDLNGIKVSVIECFETDGGVNYRSDRLI